MLINHHSLDDVILQNNKNVGSVPRQPPLQCASSGTPLIIYNLGTRLKRGSSPSAAESSPGSFPTSTTLIWILSLVNVFKDNTATGVKMTVYLRAFQLPAWVTRPVTRRA